MQSSSRFAICDYNNRCSKIHNQHHEHHEHHEHEITTLVGKKLEGDHKLRSLAASNGSIYGIPGSARRVVKFNPVDKSMTLIGPDFSGGYKRCIGAMTDSGINTALQVTPVVAAFSKLKRTLTRSQNWK